MDRSFHESSFEFEDQYIPSGNWYPLNHDDSNTESSFSENYSSNYLLSNHNTDQKSLYHHDFQSYDSRTVSPFASNNDTTTDTDDPFSVRCRIPVPDLVPVSNYQLWLETSFMCRRNERERQRVRSVNDGFSRLRNHLPRSAQIKRRQSKVETLRHAINYIKQLQMLLDNKTNISDNRCKE
ncbi:BHLH domain-containing protein [Trichonephila inaurata madagascariensis]|uniref:BHLH domain-containing protein n=1 Tax=Trichonephila inaurata madagascariensis TaxID=2747483 RepID=A0A8X7BSZ0_9ARAC|nr:BHLH domain-containing protein [Trichonephila inaurata madagascariensis]